MGNRLNVSDEAVIREIEAKYLEKINEAKEETSIAVKKLRDRIAYYRSNNLIDVINNAENKAKDKFGSIKSARNTNELKIAIYVALLNERGNAEVSDELCESIDNIISELSDKQKDIILEDYKERTVRKLIEIETERAKKEYTLIKYMSDEEIEEYISKYEKAYLAGCLLKAKRSSIQHEAYMLGADLPKCIQYDEKIEEKTSKIVKREKQNIKDFSIKERIKEKMSKVTEAIDEHAPDLARSIIGTHIFGIFITAGIHDATSMGLAATFMTLLASSAALNAIVSAIICKKEIKQDIKEVLEDKEVIDEAKKTGLLDLSVAYCKACTELTSYKDSIRKSAIIHETGRIM